MKSFSYAAVKIRNSQVLKVEHIEHRKNSIVLCAFCVLNRFYTGNINIALGITRAHFNSLNRTQPMTYWFGVHLLICYIPKVGKYIAKYSLNTSTLRQNNNKDAMK